MAEHHLDGPVVGLACDGTGYGDGGQIWGGEILIADLLGYRRAAHFQALPLPGGDAAAKEPWRMAISALDQTFGPRFLDLDLDLVARHGEDQVRRLLEVIRRPALSPETTSLGRLFDAAAALAGIKDRSAYEGQAAMMLEMRCPNALPAQGYPFDLSENGDGTLIIGSAAMFEALVRDLDRGADESAISGRFHAGVVDALVETAHRVARDNGLDRIVLSGGCFLNQVLLAEVSDRLTRLGRQVFAPSQVPAGDGGLSLGQAAIAGAMAAR
jgi:hydrogenase maturation protein HypF